MRITKASLGGLQEKMADAKDQIERIEDPIETWLDEEADREERADARQEIEDTIDELVEAVGDLHTYFITQS